MDSALRLRPRDLTLLEALALRVRLISQRQAADAFWHGHCANARRRFSQLATNGMVTRNVVNAQPLPEIIEPIVRWQPGQASPDANNVAYQVQSRWRFRALRPTVVYFPTTKTITQFGGCERSQTKLTQVTHDLGVTAVWLRYASQDSNMTAMWIGEDILAPTRIHQKLPDAALVDKQGEPKLLIEFGGSYGPERIADFHEDAEARGLPYHLW
ncbi:hypothetical protein TBK1r_44220 [Stieleria magnilauensis]|uniref:Replication-relaxation n=1 Tax=Stieleria magnilauensis TaxID=2527963 RepID=A0ABX5XXN5_9BACT|nr:hypothetical protein TBK1r_44220 [Planctomycetes bacterium TBK1r]